MRWLAGSRTAGRVHSLLWGWAEGPGRGPKDPSRGRASPFSHSRSSEAPLPPLSFAVVPKSPGQGAFPGPGAPSGGQRKQVKPRKDGQLGVNPSLASQECQALCPPIVPRRKGHSPGAGPPLGVLCRGNLSVPGPSRLSQASSPGNAAATSSSSSSSSLSDE